MEKPLLESLFHFHLFLFFFYSQKKKRKEKIKVEPEKTWFLQIHSPGAAFL